MSVVIEKMLAKDPAQRYQTPRELAEALAPWTQTAIAPPTEAEMPRLSLAATGASSSDASLVGQAQPPSGTRKAWQVSAPTARPVMAPPTPMAAPETHGGAASGSPTSREARPVAVPVARPVAPSAAAPAAPEEEEDSIPWERVAA